MKKDGPDGPAEQVAPIKVPRLNALREQSSGWSNSLYVAGICWNELVFQRVAQLDARSGRLVAVDQEDSGGFQDGTHGGQSFPVRRSGAAFEIGDGRCRHAKLFRQLRLTPIQQGPGGAALFLGNNHNTLGLRAAMPLVVESH